jgi:hypothetical protein
MSMNKFFLSTKNLPRGKLLKMSRNFWVSWSFSFFLKSFLRRNLEMCLGDEGRTGGLGLDGSVGSIVRKLYFESSRPGVRG